MKSKRAAVVALAVVAAAAMAVPPAAAATTPHRDGYHPSTALVAFSAGIADHLRDAAHGAIGARVVNTMDWLNLDVVSLPRGLDPAIAAARYRELPGVTHAGVNKKIRALSNPNDVLYGDQWGFHNTDQLVKGSLVNGVPDSDIDAPEGWSIAFGDGRFESSGGTRVAVLDTGIERGHVEFLNKVKACASATSAFGVVVEGTCSDDNLHGTHTAGTVGALTNNTTGVGGTAPNAELSIFKFLNGAGVGFLADEIAGIRWAYTTGQAKVLSMSFGAYESDGSEQAAVRDATNAGALLIAASGNDYDDTKNYPAAYAEVMSVASSNQANQISEFTSCNSDVEIAAPGEDIWSTFPGNSYGVISGTSMATPHVAGIAALIMSEKGLGNAQTRNQIVNTAVSGVGSGGRNYCGGYKLANLANALGGSNTEPPPPPGPGTITGRVTEQKGGAAIAAASVNCGSAGSATTGTNGSYTISNAPAGTWTCTASKSGYASKNANVTVTSGQTSTANFALRKV